MKKRYFTPEQKRAAERARSAERRARNRVKLNAQARLRYLNRSGGLVRPPYQKVHNLGDDPVSPRPPNELVLEHELRCELVRIHNSTTVLVGDLTSLINGDPPPQYAGSYASTAAKQQAAFRNIEWCV